MTKIVAALAAASMRRIGWRLACHLPSPVWRLDFRRLVWLF